MANYAIKENLLKINGAFISNIKGKTAIKRCLCIPIEDSGLYEGEKGCYLSLTAIQLQETRFGDTHCIKLAVGKEDYDNMTEDQRKAIPILGGMKEIERSQKKLQEVATVEAVSLDPQDDDLPF